MLATFAYRSLISRRKSAILSLLSLVMSISVLLSVEHIRNQTKDSFNRTISGVDLIVGAPSGQLNLLLYSIFRMGSPTNNIDYHSYLTLAENDQIAWAIPISLGDSHRGYRVMGTTTDYFQYFKYGDRRQLAFAQGQAFSHMFEAVIGAEVAEKLNYAVGDPIVIAHGIGSTSFTKHDHSPFKISGVLARTGTPVDQTVHVSLGGIEAIHLPPAELKQITSQSEVIEPVPTQVTSVLLGLNSKFATFSLQRQINNYKQDRLMAILPGVAMSELWQMMGSVENILRVISVLVFASSLFGLSTMLLASMQQRQPEIAILRALGAGPILIFSLVLLESLMLVVLANLTAIITVGSAFYLMSDWLAANYGLFIDPQILTRETLIMSGLIVISSVVTSAIPAIEAYRNALHAGLTNRA